MPKKRLKVPRNEGGVAFDDAVYGTIEKKYSDLEDFIIVRSNGKPLYILSNAVDDIRDKVTHIIRGQDAVADRLERSASLFEEPTN